MDDLLTPVVDDTHLPSSPQVHTVHHSILQSCSDINHEAFAESIERILRDSRSASQARDDDLEAADNETDLHQSVAADSFASASSFTVKARTKSLFSSFFDAKQEAQTPSSSPSFLEAILTTNSGSVAPAVAAPRRCFTAKVVIVGDSGSGKTTFKQCFTSSVLKTLPEVPPSMSSGSSTFYYKSQNLKKDRLNVTVVESGPLALATGLPQTLFHTGALYIVIMSLTGVKQRGGTKRLFSSTNHTVIIHDQDKVLIQRYVQSIAATSAMSSIVLVGTHKDQLSDTSKEAMDVVLAELSQEVTKEIELRQKVGIRF